MESMYTELALYSSKNGCARTDTVFLPISEVCNGTDSLAKSPPTSIGWRYMSPNTPEQDTDQVKFLSRTIIKTN